MLQSLVMHWNRSTKLNTYRGTSVYSWNWFQVLEGTLFWVYFSRCLRDQRFFLFYFPFTFFATIIEMYFFVFKVNRCNISWWYHSDIFSFKWLSPLFPTEKSQKIKKPRNFGPKWSIMNRIKMKKKRDLLSRLNQLFLSFDNFQHSADSSKKKTF